MKKKKTLVIIENEERIAAAISRMRSWVLYGDSDSDETANVSEVPIDFIYFGDLVEIIIEFVENDLKEAISGAEAIKEIKRY